MWRSQKGSFESSFSAQDNIFYIRRIHPSGYLGICAYRGMITSHFLKEWFDGLVGFEWQVFLKE